MKSVSFSLWWSYFFSFSLLLFHSFFSHLFILLSLLFLRFLLLHLHITFPYHPLPISSPPLLTSTLFLPFSFPPLPPSFFPSPSLLPLSLPLSPPPPPSPSSCGPLLPHCFLLSSFLYHLSPLRVRSKEYKKRAMQRLTLKLGPELEIGVGVWVCREISYCYCSIENKAVYILYSGKYNNMLVTLGIQPSHCSAYTYNIVVTLGT